MIEYGCSNVSLKPQLPSLDVKIPLKYSTNDIKGTVADVFNTKISHHGQFLTTESFINNISIDILNDLKTVTLTPLRTSLDVKTHKIVVNLPNKIIPGCYSVNLVHTSDDPQIIFDFLDEKYLFITLVIDLKDFLKEDSFNLSKFNQWGHISVPYSFELRSQPFKFKSLDVHNFIISLDDGGLLHFRRSSTLSDFDIYNFDTYSLLGWFKARQNERVVDMIQDNNQLITLTINKVLKFWDLTTHELKSSLSLINNNFLNPGNYFLKLNDDIIFHATNSFESDHNVTFYKLNDGKLSTFQITTPLKRWYVQNFKIFQSENSYEMYVLWKCNISTMVVHYTLSSDFQTISIKSQDLTESSSENLNYYDELIISTAINTVREKLDLPLITEINEGIINDTVEKLGKPGLLSSICEEYNVLSQEGIDVTISNDEIIILQTNGFGVLRPLSYFEQFVTSDIAETDKLSMILSKLDIHLSTKTTNKVYDTFSKAPRVTNQLLTQISEMTNIKMSIDDITNTLNQYPHVVETLDNLIGKVITSETKEFLSSFDKAIVGRTIKDLQKRQKLVLTKVLILLSHVDAGDLSINYGEKIHNLFRNFAIVEAVDNLVVNSAFPVQTSVIEKYYYVCQVINDENYVIQMIGGLLRTGQWKSVYSILDRVNNKYLEGVIYLLNDEIKGLEYLDFDNYKNNNIDFEQLGLPEFIGFTDEGSYYHFLSQFIRKKFPQSAIEFQLKAIEFGNEDYESLFQLSIESSLDLDPLIKALSNLTTSPQFKTFLKKTILKLIELNKLNEIFNPFFLDYYKLIDTILWELVSSSDSITSIKFHEIIYSWRVNQGDLRGAAEGLYYFISHFKHDLSPQDLKLVYLKMIEFYLVIMNCLKSFQHDDEKWLLSGKIVTLNDIYGEYNNYLKKLNQL
ncbi:hypothetical protein CLIB1444_04S04258 [[Candida] jaroonii]|uniref:Uncharacterized protein n=1 Tax=[Candida] jaroonii TaxID=467808 RepID=A0ACA9Y7I6_9ASCO|nr:hypothetical protein CLIB1444_04S04258 [[Candida] jaroonii]